jgi:hypothetical protein
MLLDIDNMQIAIRRDKKIGREISIPGCLGCRKSRSRKS